jgi:hypothetical protein
LKPSAPPSTSGAMDHEHQVHCPVPALAGNDALGGERSAQNAWNNRHGPLYVSQVLALTKPLCMPPPALRAPALPGALHPRQSLEAPHPRGPGRLPWLSTRAQPNLHSARATRALSALACLERHSQGEETVTRHLAPRRISRVPTGREQPRRRY